VPGVSLVTGPMIRETVQIAREAKRYPDKPVVLGGWHPSLLPDQTLAAEYVDMVVKGQGEDALLEIVAAHRSGRVDEGHRGRGLQGGRPVFSMCRATLRPIREMPPKAYHLADFDAYQRVCGRRWAMYTSSLACPTTALTAPTTASTGASGMRSSPSRCGRDHRSGERYVLQLLWIVDDNFLVDRERAVGIAEGLVRKGVKFDWSIQASTNLVTRLQVEE
jgi:anaerobic magnesium-protoporphyrin IX monomethyl ester cyclase